MLTLVHTNDFHNRLTIPMAERLRARREAIGGPAIVLDAGDAGGSTNITFRSAGEPILEQMSLLGYDAMTVGNRDFHVTRYGFLAKLFRARFPILCANIRSTARPQPSPHDAVPLYPLGEPTHADRDREPPLQSYVLLQPAPEWTVVVFGLTVPMVTARMWERRLSAYLFDDPIQVAARLVPQLRAMYAPDLLIALTHIGLRRDRELASAVPGIHLIVGGHSHEVLPEGERAGDCLIVQAGSYGRYVGIVEIEHAAVKGSGEQDFMERSSVETADPTPEKPLWMTARLEAL